MEKGKISSLQMAVMMIPTIVATAILGVPSIIARHAQNDMWLSVIFSAFFGYVAVLIAYQLHQLYPEKTVIQFSEQITGRFAGKILGFLLLLFYIHTTGLIVRSYAEFVVGSFLLKTPIIVVIATMIFLCACIVRGGIEVIGRAAQLFLPLFIVPLLILILLVYNDFDFKNIFPVLGNGIMPPLKGAIVPGAWFTEFFLITFLLPYVSDKEKAHKYAMMSVTIVMAMLLVVVLVVLFVLGPTIISKIYPLMTVARYISIANFFEHLESAVMGIWVIGAFVKTSVFLYAASIGTAQWLNLDDYRPIVWPIGILITVFSLWSLANSMEVERYNVGTFPPFALCVQILLPLLLLGIALAKKTKTQKR